MNEITRKKTAVGVPERREQVIEILNEAYSRNAIELDEFEERIDLVEHARYMEDLDAIIGDIPVNLQQTGQQKINPDHKSQNKKITAGMCFPLSWKMTFRAGLKATVLLLSISPAPLLWVKPLLLRALAFSHSELETLLWCMVKIMHADKRIRLEEKSIINLFPSLWSIAREDAPEELKSDWRKKLIAASYGIKTILSRISDFTKRSTSLVILFLIAGSDKHIDTKEISYIVNKIAKPWNYAIIELIDLLTKESDKIFIPGIIIECLRLLDAKCLSDT